MIKVTVTLHLHDDGVEPVNPPVTDDQVTEALTEILDGVELWVETDDEDGEQALYTTDVREIIVDGTMILSEPVTLA